MAGELRGKKIAFLIANEGVEEVELTKPLEAVREAGAEAEPLAPEAGEIQAFDHLDKAETLAAAKPVGVICHGPWTLIEADVVKAAP